MMMLNIDDNPFNEVFFKNYDDIKFIGDEKDKFKVILNENMVYECLYDSSRKVAYLDYFYR